MANPYVDWRPGPSGRHMPMLQSHERPARTLHVRLSLQSSRPGVYCANPPLTASGSCSPSDLSNCTRCCPASTTSRHRRCARSGTAPDLATSRLRSRDVRMASWCRVGDLLCLVSSCFQGTEFESKANRRGRLGLVLRDTDRPDICRDGEGGEEQDQPPRQGAGEAEAVVGKPAHRLEPRRIPIERKNRRTQTHLAQLSAAIFILSTPQQTPYSSSL